MQQARFLNKLSVSRSPTPIFSKKIFPVNRQSKIISPMMIEAPSIKRFMQIKAPLYNLDTGPTFDELAKTPTLPFYKLKADPSQGAALILKYVYASKCIFIDAANQKGERKKPGTEGTQYNWDNKVVIRLNLTELGTLLTVLDGKQKSCEIKHTKRDEHTSKTQYVSTFVIARNDNGGYAIKMTKILGSELSTEVKGDVIIQIEDGEGILFAEFLRNSIRSSLGFF